MEPLSMAAGVGISLLGSVLGGRSKRKAARAQAQAAKAIAQGANRQRKAKNVASAAAGDLNRTIQDINNRRLLDAGVKTDAAAKEQLVALADAQSARTFEGRVQAAERAGSLATQAALSGVAGGSFEAIQGTLALQQARREEIQGRAAARQQSVLEVGMGQQASNLIAGLDTTAILPAIDRTITPMPSTRVGGSVISDLAAGINKVGVGNVGAAAEAVAGAVQNKLSAWNWQTSDNDAGYAATGGLPLQYQTEDD